MKEYVLKFVDPQVTIQEEAKKDFKDLMGWDEETFMRHVFVRLSNDTISESSEVVE